METHLVHLHDHFADAATRVWSPMCTLAFAEQTGQLPPHVNTCWSCVTREVLGKVLKEVD
jgi:hypothetical protein